MSLREDFIDESGSICPKCFTKTINFAVPMRDHWLFVLRCGCRYINDPIRWPFTDKIVYESDVVSAGFTIYKEEVVNEDIASNELIKAWWKNLVEKSRSIQNEVDKINNQKQK